MELVIWMRPGLRPGNPVSVKGCKIFTSKALRCFRGVGFGDGKRTFGAFVLQNIVLLKDVLEVDYRPVGLSQELWLSRKARRQFRRSGCTLSNRDEAKNNGLDSGGKFKYCYAVRFQAVGVPRQKSLGGNRKGRSG